MRLKCKDVERNYDIELVEIETRTEKGMVLDYERTCFMLYRCPCMDHGWYPVYVGDTCEYHATFGAYCREFKERCPHWNFCLENPIFPGYFNWSYQTYFRFFEQFLTYAEKNRQCDCFWPHCNSYADLISMHVFCIIDWLGECTELIEKMASKKFSPYLNYGIVEEFVRGLFVHAYFYSQYHQILNDVDQFCFRNCSTNEYQKIHEKLIIAENSIIPLFQEMYSKCLKKHPHPKIFYERGMTYFHNGHFLESMDDIRQLIDYAEKNNCKELLTSDLYLQEGRLLNETLSYDEAIVSLTKAIQKDPKNKEAYFERAIAYFETGYLSSAVSDYKKSGIKVAAINKKDGVHYIQFSSGIATGILKGGMDSSIEFVPSLLSSIWGLSKGLWCVISKPVEVSKEFIEACKTCLALFKDKTILQSVSELIPEIQEYIQKMDQLKDEEKGHLIGYVIGRYGVDIFACSGCAKAIKAYQGLKRANTILTLDRAALSSKHEKEIAAASEKYFKAREEYKKKCQLHVGQQEKHIPGSTNFMEGKGELTIPIEKLKKLAKPRLGTGIPTRTTFGEAGYRETVDFGEIIGNHFSLQTKEKFPTSIGDIHYNKEGGYHVVPVKPDKLQRLLKK